MLLTFIALGWQYQWIGRALIKFFAQFHATLRLKREGGREENRRENFRKIKTDGVMDMEVGRTLYK